MAAVGLGSMLIQMILLTTCLGVNGTIETFVSQNYGAGLLKNCGMQLNRGFLIVSLVFLPLTIFMFFIDSVLIGLGQDPEISVIASKFIFCSLPGTYLYVLFDARKRFLQSIEYSFVSTYTIAFTSMLHFFWCYLFIVYMQLGVQGVAIVLNITYSLNFLIQEAYVRLYNRKKFVAYETELFCKESLSGWKRFLILAMPTTFLTCIEWWAFEI